jgi:phosphoenolpyruvate carboxykinase (ATP)
MKLKYTRAIIDAIHNGSLANAPTETDPVFGLEVPTLCEGVPSEILIPRNTWSDKAAYDRQANKVGALFRKNFEKYADKASAEVLAAAPKGEAVEGLVLKEEG